MNPIVNVEIPKKPEISLAPAPKYTYKLSLLFNDESETKRCRELIDLYINNNISKVTYDITEMIGGKQVLSIVANPSALSEVIKMHATNELK